MGWGTFGARAESRTEGARPTARAEACFRVRATPAEDQSEIGRWQSPRHSAHDGDQLLARGWRADVRATVYGNAVWQIAGLFQGRGRAAHAVEHPGHSGQVVTGFSREGFRAGTNDRDAEDHQRGEERS